MKKALRIHRWAAAVISVVMLCGIMPVMSVQSAEETVDDDDTLLSFEELREMFPAGRYWNHMGMDTNNPKGTTDIPCDHKQNGTKYCNKSYQYDNQCYGYAQELGLLLYGSRFNSWEHDRNMEKLKPGDVITYNYVGALGGHTVMVTDVKEDNVYYTDCNYFNTCRITWDSIRSKDFFESQFMDEYHSYLNGVYHAPFEAPERFVESGHIMTEEETAGQILPDGSYRIVSSLKPNYFLNHTESTGQEKDANVMMNLYNYSDAPGKNDIWEIKYQDNGFYTIREKESGLYLSVSDDSTNSRTNTVLQEQNDSDTQLWSVSASENGYEIRSKCGAWYLNVEGMKAEDGRNVQVWINDGIAQGWGFIPEKNPDADPIRGDMYYIRSVSDPEYYLHVTGLDASHIVIFECRVELSKDQKDAFSVANFQSGEDYYGIGLPYKDDFMYMDINADYSWENYMKDGYELGIYLDSADTVKQNLYWDIRPAGSGSYYIVSNAAGYYLSSEVEEKGDEANLSQRHFTGEDCQKWILEPVNAPADPVTGDVNGDGEFNISDIILFQNWLLAVPDTHFANWKTADFCDDNKLDAFDLCLMKQELLKAQNETDRNESN